MNLRKNPYEDSKIISLFSSSRSNSKLNSYLLKKQDQLFISDVEKLFKIDLNNRFVLFVASRFSLIEPYLEKKFQNQFVIKPSMFSNEMAYRSLVGAAPGYIGSDRPSQFMQFLQKMNQEKSDAAVIVKGLFVENKQIFDDFLSNFRDGYFVDPTANIKEKLSVKNIKLILVHYDSIENALDFEKEKIINHVYEKAVETKTLTKLFDLVFLKAFSINHFFNFYDHLNEIEKRFKKILDDEKVDSEFFEKISRAAYLFKLENELLYQIAKRKNFEIEERSNKLYLIDLENDKILSTKTIINEKSYIKFVENLDGYFFQDEAVYGFKQALAQMISERENSDFSKPKRPFSIMCVGPPGVGKTELAKRLGSAVGNFVRIDANQVTSIEKLFGSESKRGLLFESLKPNEANVVLFDEIEKIDYHALLALLQILDEGRATDLTTLTTFHLDQTIFVFTSNAIQEEVSELDAREELVRKGFPKEFIDRINSIAVFRRFSLEEKIEIYSFFSKKKIEEIEDETIEKLKRIESVRQIKLLAEKEKVDKKVKELDKLSLEKLSQSRKLSDFQKRFLVQDENLRKKPNSGRKARK